MAAETPDEPRSNAYRLGSEVQAWSLSVPAYRKTMAVLGTIVAAACVAYTARFYVVSDNGRYMPAPRQNDGNNVVIDTRTGRRYLMVSGGTLVDF